MARYTRILATTARRVGKAREPLFGCTTFCDGRGKPKDPRALLPSRQAARSGSIRHFISPRTFLCRVEQESGAKMARRKIGCVIQNPCMPVRPLHVSSTLVLARCARNGFALAYGFLIVEGVAWALAACGWTLSLGVLTTVRSGPILASVARLLVGCCYTRSGGHGYRLRAPGPLQGSVRAPALLSRYPGCRAADSAVGGDRKSVV